MDTYLFIVLEFGFRLFNYHVQVDIVHVFGYVYYYATATVIAILYKSKLQTSFKTSMFVDMHAHDEID